MISVSDALRKRVSIRAFRPDPVPETLVRDILDVARFAPSGGNLQPWRVIAVTGAARDAAIEVARKTENEEGEHPAYPASLWEPYRSRRYKTGEDLYATLNIPREDKPARLRQFAHNYDFFGAPVGLYFVIDKRLGRPQWAHLGMFMQSIALAAVERGLGTCMQEIWGRSRVTLGAHFALPEEDMLYCGMAVGYVDEDAPVNKLRTDRTEVDEFTVFRGF